MREYSYQDMLRMQEDAADRVREMKKRATLAMDDECPSADNDRHDEKKQGLFELLAGDSDALLILALLAVIACESNDYLISLALLYILL